MQRTRMTKHNPLWDYFDKRNGTSSKRTAVCNICSKELSFKTTITNLKHHLKRCHSLAYDEYVSITKSIQTSIENDPIYTIYISKKDEEMHLESVDDDTQCSDDPIPTQKLNNDNYGSESPTLNQSDTQEEFPKEPERRKDYDLALLKMITHDIHPFSILNDVGFRSFLYALNPNYEIPENKTLSSKLIPRIYEDKLEQIKLNMQDNIKSVSVSMDCWTSINSDNYMAITVHYINQKVEPQSVLIHCGQFDEYPDEKDVYNEIKSILQDWNLFDKVNFFVTNSSTILDVAKKHLDWDSWTIFECLGFKLNQIVLISLDEINDTLAKVQRLVDYFKKNTTAKNNLLNYQITNQNSLEPKTVLKSYPTKWNSVYLMLERFIELKAAVRATILDLNTTLPDIDMQEWKIIEQLCIILKPFYEAINEMFNDTYLLASKAFVLTASLTSICNNYVKLKDLSVPIKNVALILKDGLQNQLQNLELNIPICISIVLDPRFKLKPIKSIERISVIKTKIIAKMTDELDNQNQDTNIEDPMSTSSNADPRPSESNIPSFSLWNEFDNEANIAPKTSMENAAEELEKYLAEPLIRRTECIYKWWQEWQNVYPTLFELYKQSCNIMLTSAPCEHIFSHFPNGINDRRNCLSTSEVSHIMFLNANGFDYECEY